MLCKTDREVKLKARLLIIGAHIDATSRLFVKFVDFTQEKELKDYLGIIIIERLIILTSSNLIIVKS